MSTFGARRVIRKTRTAASLPGRVVACEDRCSALETDVKARIEEMRSELAEIRALLKATIDGDIEATALLGRLLQSSEARLDALESAGRNEPGTGGGSAP